MTKQWQLLVDKSGGSYAIFTKTLETKSTIEHNSTEVVESMSTIKLPILLLLLSKVQTGQLSLRQKIHVNRSDVGRCGSGIMQYFYLNGPFQLYNLAEMMMSISDNVATNRLIKLLGKKEINRYIKSLGLKNTKLLMTKIDFPISYKVGQDENLGLTTPQEMASLIELLLTGKLLNPTYTKMAKKILEQIQYSYFSRLLPYRSYKRFGSKTGGAAFRVTGMTITNECGFIVDKNGQTHIFSMFSRLPMDRQFPYSVDSSAKVEFAQVAAALYKTILSI